MWQSRPSISETALPSAWSRTGWRHLDIVAHAVRSSDRFEPPGLDRARLRGNRVKTRPGLRAGLQSHTSFSLTLEQLDQALGSSSLSDSRSIASSGVGTVGSSAIGSSCGSESVGHQDRRSPGVRPAGDRPLAHRQDAPTNSIFICATPSSLDRAPRSLHRPARRTALRHCWPPASRSSHRGSAAHSPAR